MMSSHSYMTRTRNKKRNSAIPGFIRKNGIWQHLVYLAKRMFLIVVIRVLATFLHKSRTFWGVLQFVAKYPSLYKRAQWQNSVFLCKSEVAEFRFVFLVRIISWLYCLHTAARLQWRFCDFVSSILRHEEEGEVINSNPCHKAPTG